MRHLLFFLLFTLVLSCNEENPSIQSLSPKELTSELEDFGEKLFFDNRLSLNNTVSCSSCHKPNLAFADTVAISPGVEGRLGFRNAPSLLNVGAKPVLMLDGAVPNLEMQAIVPIQDHNEMSIPMGDLIAKLRNIKQYNDLSHRLFNRDIDAFVVTRALAAYERTLISRESLFDKYIKDPDNYPLTDGEQRGWSLFKEKRCVECHSLPDFTNYNVSVTGFDLDSNDLGRFRITADSSDIGKFVVPSLRNVSLTKPYLHNGSVGTIEEVVLLHYNKIDLQTGDTYPLLSQYDADFIVRFLTSLESTK
ncbi:MAG: cytochrome-c peroxidase [Crocinitomicaceae bacterium]